MGGSYTLAFPCFVFLFKILFIFRERGREGERVRKTSMCGCLSRPPTRDQPAVPGTCPDWELNLRLFGSQASPHSTEQHQPGLRFNFKGDVIEKLYSKYRMGQK